MSTLVVNSLLKDADIYSNDWQKDFASVNDFAHTGNNLQLVKLLSDAKTVMLQAFGTQDREELLTTLNGMWHAMIELISVHNSDPHPPTPNSRKRSNDTLAIKNASKNARNNKINKKRQLPPETIETSNPFDGLTDESDLIEIDDNTTEAAEVSASASNSENNSENKTVNKTPPQSNKIEPITLKYIDNWEEVFNALETKLQSKIKRKFKGDTIRLFPKTIDEYRVIQAFLDGSKLEAYSRQLKADRPMKVLLKGIPPNTPIERVKNEILAKGYKVHRVSQLTQ